jgi:hypothetical protein
MTDAMLRFSVRWAGSNMQIALLLRIDATTPAYQNNSRLQERVGALVNIDPRHIKILLTSPAGPQLTPVLVTLALVRTDTKIEDSPSHKAMVAAWSSLKADQVYNVFVTQHSEVELGVDLMYTKSGYFTLPLALQRNPVVAVVALELGDRINMRLPDELANNKKFALYAMSQVRASAGSLLWHFSDTLCDDEEVVLKGVARHPGGMCHASNRLRSTKTFALNAVSVNGLCIFYTFRSDKDVALAAVRQNAAAFDYLCDALKADKDIQEACRTVQTGLDPL